MYEPLAGRASTGTVVLRLVANDDGLARCSVYDGTVSGTQHCFSLTVAVPVEGHDVVLVVLEVGHVRSEVYPPQLLAVELIHLDDGILTVVAGGQIALGGIAVVVELEEDFHLTVAVNIGAARIVGHVGALQVAVVHLHFQVVVAPNARSGALRLRNAPHNRLHRVGAACGAALVQVVGHAEWCRIDFRPVAVDVVLHVVVLLCGNTPTAKHSLAGFNRHKTAIQLVGHALGYSRAHECRKQKCQ